MTNRLCSVATIVASGGLLLAGCGSSSSSSSPSTSSSATSSAPAATPTSTSPNSTSISSGGTSAPANLSQAVARCKASIASAPQLSADAKNKLNTLCDKAAKGNTADLRKSTAQVCQEIVKESVPASYQQQALANCPKP